MTHFLDSLGWAVLHASWQGALALAAVMLWRLALRDGSPALRHAGQMVALVACLVAFLWTFAAYLGAPEVTASALSGAMTPESGTGRISGALAPLTSALGGTLVGTEDGGLALSSLLSRVTPWLAALWAVGFCAMSLRYAFAFGQMQHLRTLGIASPGAAWEDRFARLLDDCGVSARVRLFVSANVADPLTLGLFKPVVLVPIGFLTGLPGDQVEAVLRHELAHIRRHDYAINLVQTAVKTVLFFHPAVHIIARWNDRDREQACDDLALHGGRDPLDLVRGLATLRLQAHGAPQLAMGALGGRSGKSADMPLMTRLSRLSGERSAPRRPEQISVSVLSAMLIGAVYLASGSGTALPAQAHPHPLPSGKANADGSLPLDLQVTIPAPARPPITMAAPPAPMIAPPVVGVPDTVVTAPPAPYAPGAPGVAPVPPVRPVFAPITPEIVFSESALQRQIETDQALWNGYAQTLHRYQSDLNRYIRENRVDEDRAEDLRDALEDMQDDMEDLFEDRHDAMVEMREARQELARIGGTVGAEVSREVMAGLSSALADLDIDIAAETNRAAKHGLEQARREIARSLRAVERDAAREHRQAERDVQREKQHAKRHAARIDAEVKRAEARASTYYTALREDVMGQLLADGLIESRDETVHLTHPDNVMHLNGKRLTGGKGGKYCKILERHGILDNDVELTIAPDAMTLLTDYRDGEHKTQVTYGVWND